MIEKYKLLSRILFTVLWIQLCYGFVCTDLILALEPTRSYLNLLFDMVYLLSGLLLIRDRRDVMVFVSFMAIALLSAFLNHQGIVALFNGFRDFIGLIFVPPILRYFLSGDNAGRFVHSVDKFFYIFLWIQVPCVVSQFIRFGAGDAGGGSLGNGGSGIVSTFIYVISFYLMNKRWDETQSYIQNLWANRELVFLLFPSFLNETKISFIFFIAYFLLLMRIDSKLIFRVLFMSPLIAILFAGIGYIYLVATGTDADHFDADYFNEYLLGEDIYHLMEVAEMVQDEVIETDNLWVVDLPRYGRLMVTPELLQDETGGGVLLGAGIGQFKGGTHLEYSPFAQNYQWFLKGSPVMIFSLLVQLGVIGVIWLFWAVFSWIFTRGEVSRHNNMLLYMSMVSLLIFTYNDSFRQTYFCLVLGYVFFYGLQSRLKDTDNERVLA